MSDVRSPGSRAAVLLCALALLAAGCGGSGDARDVALRGTVLAIYASAPLHGPGAGTGIDVVRGARLALAEQGGRAGSYRLRLLALDAAPRTPGDSEPAQISENARRAARDPRTVAYVGELRSGASAISIPILNEAGIAQLSPLDSALGLTTPSAAITGSPERYYPNAERVGRTFTRLVGSDRGQAAALVRLLVDEGRSRLALLTDGHASGLALAAAVRPAARAADVAIVASEDVDVHAGEDRELVAQLLARRPDAVLYAGGVLDVAARIWRELAVADPTLALLAPSALAEPAFAARLGPAAEETQLTRPLLGLRDYPPPAGRVARAFALRYGATPSPEALHGYEAMRAVLAAIRRAVAAAGDGRVTRSAVVRRLWATSVSRSVLGPYRFDAHGDATLDSWGAYRVAAGRLRFDRAIAPSMGGSG